MNHIMSRARLSVLEICAGGGGQAFGLEGAGFAHAAAIENDGAACATLRANRPKWTVIEGDVRGIHGGDWSGVDLLAGGVPCPPFSIAGDQLGADDQRDLFPEALRLVRQARPRAVLLENVPGFASAKFTDYRNDLLLRLSRMGYVPDWRVLSASDYGVPQLRPRFVLVAMQKKDMALFSWPEAVARMTTVADAISDLMGARGWPGIEAWCARANRIAPTLVGGSKKHGGPDLGPTRARAEWAKLGVNGVSLAEDAPGPDFPTTDLPRLTVRMAARVQGFSDEWKFEGRKTSAYRQVGNAFPPPVAKVVGVAIRRALEGKQRRTTPDFRPQVFQPTLFR